MNITEAIIPAGSFKSIEIDLGECRLRALNMPEDWDQASLYFLVSVDGIDYRFLSFASTTATYADGLVISGLQSLRGCAVSFQRDHFHAYRYLMLHSGKPDAPVIQSADRKFELVNW